MSPLIPPDLAPVSLKSFKETYITFEQTLESHSSYFIECDPVGHILNSQFQQVEPDLAWQALHVRVLKSWYQCHVPGCDMIIERADQIDCHIFTHHASLVVPSEHPPSGTF